MVLKPNTEAPHFEGKAIINGAIKTINLNQYSGKYLILLFYPTDFTFVCPTEIIAFNDRIDEIKNRNCEIIACSTDTEYSHWAWNKMYRRDGGLGLMRIPLLSDRTKSISRSYHVLDETNGWAYRGLFLIDPQGLVRHVTVNDNSVGRCVDEALRLLDAFQFVEKHGEVCPINWKPGSKGIKIE